jgi:hypothetical protein
MKKENNNKYNTEMCNNRMTFQECELAVLRNAVDESESLKKEQIGKNEIVDDIIAILEDFLRKKKLICYGGTAINNILPESVQFYDRTVDIPDYDFYSPNALSHAKELSKLYKKKGYDEVEAKAGVHYGTFKVYVNFIPIADITYLNEGIFKKLSNEAITISGIKYCPPNFLRMNMYLELSRPMGDVSRWEKILKRLILLSKYYPLKFKKNCSNAEYQRNIDSLIKSDENIYEKTRDILINQDLVFFGGFASSLYSKYMDTKNPIVKKIPDFDVLSENPEHSAEMLVEDLDIKNLTIEKQKSIGEIIPEHVIVKLKKVPIVYFYKPLACHSYNIINFAKEKVKIATIDTILTFYLAFMYADLPYYNKDRLLCMAKLLFDVEAKNRLSQKGILKRFSINCYGHQKTLEEIRSEKSDKFKQLKNKMNSKEYEMWFLKYNPSNKNKAKKNNKTRTKKNTKKNKTSRKNDYLF